LILAIPSSSMGLSVPLSSTAPDAGNSNETWAGAAIALQLPNATNNRTSEIVNAVFLRITFSSSNYDELPSLVARL
jgi:hypothetical protein